MKTKVKRVFRLPTSYTIIMMLIALIGICTHFFPKSVGVKAADLSDILISPLQGFQKGVPVILFILIIGGFLKVMNHSGALEEGIAKIVAKTQGKEIYLIPILMFLISLGGSTYGMDEETIPMYPMVIGAMLLCGYDVLTGVATVLLGVLAGVSGSTINPFATGAAVDALKTGAKINANQALVMGMGAFVWIISFAVSAVYVMRYAKTVQKDPAKTRMTSEETKIGNQEFSNGRSATDVHFTNRMKWILIVFGISFAFMIIALIPWGKYGITIFSGWSSFLTGAPIGEWYFSDLCIWFLIMTVVIGKMNGMDERQMISTFLAGAGELVGVAMIVGLSKGVSAIMATTHFDTYLLTMGKHALQGISGGLFTVIAYLLNTGFAMLIPSTSGRAAAIIPTLGGITKSLGYSPEVMIVTYLASQSIIGLVPVSGNVMSALNISHIEFTTWVKFYWKLFLILTIIKIAFLSIMMTVL